MKNYIAKSFSDIFKEIDPSTMQIKNTLTVPNDFYRRLLDYVLERGYLNEVGEREPGGQHPDAGDANEPAVLHDIATRCRRPSSRPGSPPPKP